MKTAVVTGAAGGLGRQVALQLLEEGHRVVSVDVSILDEPADRAVGDRHRWVQADVSDEGSIQAAFDTAVSTFGSVELVAHCAGIGGSMAPLADIDLADFDRVMAVNARGTFLTLRTALRVLAAADDAGGPDRAIVVVSSVRGVRGIAGMAAYAASKHAVLGLMKVAAIEAKAQGIRVNAVLPGLMDTPMMAGLAQGGFDPTSARPADPSEVARAVVWLLSDAAGYATGAELVIDAGRTL